MRKRPFGNSVKTVWPNFESLVEPWKTTFIDYDKGENINFVEIRSQNSPILMAIKSQKFNSRESTSYGDQT